MGEESSTVLALGKTDAWLKIKGVFHCVLKASRALVNKVCVQILLFSKFLLLSLKRAAPKHNVQVGFRLQSSMTALGKGAKLLGPVLLVIALQ